MTREAELVQAAQGGDVNAFEELVRQHQQRIVALCRSRVRCVDSAEDLAQETFLRAWMNLDRLRPPYAFGAWTRSIAMNLTRTRQRSEARAAAHGVNVGGEGLAQIPAPRAEAQTVADEIAEVVEQLPPDRAELLELFFAQGLTKAEIAQRKGVHPATIGRHLDRAVDDLRMRLAAPPVPARDRTPIGPRAPRAYRTVAIIAALTAISGHASAAPATAATTTSGSTTAKVLTFLSKGLSIMGTTKKTAAVIATAAILAGGAAVYHHNQTPQPATLAEAVTQQVDRADSRSAMSHTLGTESVFELAPGEKAVLSIGANSYGYKEVAVTRDVVDASLQILFDDGSTRAFRGSLNEGNFALLGATNYIEQGSVEGSNENPPPGVMTYLVWENGPNSSRFHLATRESQAFGNGLLGIQRDVESGRISEKAATAALAKLMKNHRMLPEGEVYQQAGDQFIRFLSNAG
ncbi:MAG: RNA polymerase sigma factor [Sumerlaeia bacterium]